jgi:hypothetical protein
MAAGWKGARPAFAADPQFENPRTEFVFEAYVTLLAPVEVGPSAYGNRRAIPITGGTFEGPRIKGKVLPGGADWQLERADGGRVIEALYMLETDDGAHIVVHNKGLSILTSEGRKKQAAGQPLTAADRYLRTVPAFEAPVGPYDWLNQSIFIGTLTSPPGGERAVYVRVFRVL